MNYSKERRFTPTLYITLHIATVGVTEAFLQLKHRMNNLNSNHGLARRIKVNPSWI